MPPWLRFLGHGEAQAASQTNVAIRKPSERRCPPSRLVEKGLDGEEYSSGENIIILDMPDLDHVASVYTNT